jgi:hypothetical protein
MVIRNHAALPRMWFVDRTRVIPGADLHLREIANPAWDPGQEALLFEDVGRVDPGSRGTATITGYEPREINADLNSPGNCFLVVSEIYYQPGWEAWLDGRPVPIHRTDYALRGIKVPPGSHTLRMRFDPPAFKLGLTISIATYGLLLAALAATLVASRRRTVNAGQP